MNKNKRKWKEKKIEVSLAGVEGHILLDDGNFSLKETLWGLFVWETR